MRKLFLASAFALAAIPALAVDFTVRITDAAQIAGIAAARAAHCAALPQVDAEGKPLACPIATDAAYVQMVMQSAAESYAKQFDGAGQKKADFLATLPEAKRSAVLDALK